MLGATVGFLERPFLLPQILQHMSLFNDRVFGEKLRAQSMFLDNALSLGCDSEIVVCVLVRIGIFRRAALPRWNRWNRWRRSAI